MSIANDSYILVNCMFTLYAFNQFDKRNNARVYNTLKECSIYYIVRCNDHNVINRFINDKVTFE